MKRRQMTLWWVKYWQGHVAYSSKCETVIFEIQAKDIHSLSPTPKKALLWWELPDCALSVVFVYKLWPNNNKFKGMFLLVGELDCCTVCSSPSYGPLYMPWCVGPDSETIVYTKHMLNTKTGPFFTWCISFTEILWLNKQYCWCKPVVTVTVGLR